MALLSKNGVLSAVGGALASFVAACIDACCGKWYCHLPSYTCDQNEPGHISAHATKDECLRQCGDRVEHYCHENYECDTDPTNALASYPSKWSCEENCAKDYAWYCVYKSADYTKGSECQQGKGPDEGLVRSGPYKDKPECEEECESLYYCVLLNGFDGSQPEHYACVIDPAGHLIISGPTTQPLCEEYCSTRRRTIWCVDNKQCVISYDGPPVECSFGVFCEEHETYQDCVQICHPEKWYCITPGNPCEQRPNPPTPDAIAYSSEAACEDECDDYYCCWVSTDTSKGSYCQVGPCPAGLERSGPHPDGRACLGECNKIYCWSYNDTTTDYRTIKVCQEDSPDGCDPSGSCIHENVTQESGPYGTLTDCEPICTPPEYKWFCDNGQCKKCCSGGNCAAGDTQCPAGITLYNSSADCGDQCSPPPDCNCVPASVTVTFAAPPCASGNYTVTLDDQGGGVYSGSDAGSVYASARDCVNGKWQVSFNTNLFDPATGPCIYAATPELACGATWQGVIPGEQGDGEATATLNATRSAVATEDNPLP